MSDRFCKIGGSNLLNGLSLANAWQTPAYAQANMGASNTLKFSGGSGGVFNIDPSAIVMPVPNGTAGNPTIITDNGDGPVTFKHPGGGYFGFIRLSAGSPAKQYISFIATQPGNLKYDMEYNPNGAGIYTGDGTPHHIVFQGIELLRCNGSGVLGGNAADITFESCLIHHNGTTSAGTVPQDHGIYASGPNLIVKDCKIYNNYGWGIHVYSGGPSNYSGRQFINNWVYNNGNNIPNHKADGILIEEGTGDLIANNLIFLNSGCGVSVWRAINTRVVHNTIHENGQYGVLVSIAGTCSGVVVKNNIIIGNTLGTVRVDSPALATTIDFNITDGAVLNAAGGQTTITNHVSTGVALTEWVDHVNTTLASRNYRLKPAAKSIGAATTNEVTSALITTDITGAVRPQGGWADQGAYELTSGGGGGGSSAIWEASLQIPGSSWADSGFSGLSVRVLIKASVTTTTATAVRLIVKGRAASTYTITKVSIVERDSVTLDAVGSITQITFGSTWAAGVTVPAGGQATSDDITFALDETKDYFVTYYAAGSVGAVRSGTGTDSTWFVSGDIAGTADWVGQTIVSSWPHIYGIFLIEQADGPAPDEDAPSLSHTGTVVLSGPETIVDVDLSGSDGNEDLVEFTIESAHCSFLFTPDLTGDIIVSTT